MIALRLVIPEGLGAESLKVGSRGWLVGHGVDKELLALAISSRARGSEPIYARGSVRVLDHWAFLHGKSFNQLLRWISVKSGFGRALASWQIKSRTDLSNWVQDGKPLDLPRNETASLCCFELTNGEVVEHLVVATHDDQIRRGEVYIMPQEPSLKFRSNGLRPIEGLDEKRIAVVGLGSGGGTVALHLAAAGVGTLHLFDRDRLTTANLFRHVCDLRHLGRAKVLAVHDLIQTYDLPTRVVSHERDVVTDAEDLWQIMGEVELVLCATDNIQSRRLVNYVCVHTAIPLIMVCTFHNALIGEVIRVLPARSACYECTRLALGELGALETVEDDNSHVPYGATEERTSKPASRGTRADVAMLAALQARAAIMTLLPDISEGDSLPRDYMTWGAVREEGFPEPFRFDYPFSANWVQLERRDDCPVCSTVGMPLDPDLIEEYETIMARVQEAPKS
jgi:molybdopterin/thiamine biosynthesis adenylyltransferase